MCFHIQRYDNFAYVDNCFLLSKDKLNVTFDFTEEGTLENYLGVKIAKLSVGRGFEISQPFLVDIIIKAINFDSTTSKSARDNIPVIFCSLNTTGDGLDQQAHWNYRGLVDVFGCLQGSSNLEIAMATRQCARFNNDPKLSHESAAKKTVRCLLDTQNKGIMGKADISKGLECYLDADFSGRWKDDIRDAPQSVVYRTGYVIIA